MCNILQAQGNFLKHNFDILIIQEGLWFYRRSMKNKMSWREYEEDVKCSLKLLREMSVQFIWIQKTFQHFSTAGGIPFEIENLSKKKLERYRTCVPIKRPNDQLLYHRTLEHAHKNIFRGSNVHNVLVVDFSRDLYMMHTRFQEKEDSIPDCTHFCQRINGVPFQYAKRILELISSGKFDRVG